MGQLSHAEVAALLNAAATPESAAIRLGQSFATDRLTLEEQKIAGDLLRQLLRDASLKIRQIIADTVKNSDILPHDLALQLAQDEDSVAVPVLQCSSVLTDQDLIDVIHGDNPEKQVAIARRRWVGKTVVTELIRSDNDRAVGVLMENDGAAVTEGHLEVVAARFGYVPSIVALLRKHPKLSAHLAERLRDFTTNTLIAYFKRNPTLPEELVTQLVLKTRADLGQALRPDGTSSEDVNAMVQHLAQKDQLSPQLILRALCTGDIDLFEAALAKRAGLPLINARTLIHDGGDLGFKSVFEKAALPPRLFGVTKAALEILRSMSLEGQPFERQSYRTAIVERILTQFSELDVDDIDFLMVRLSH